MVVVYGGGGGGVVKFRVRRVDHLNGVAKNLGITPVRLRHPTPASW